MGINFFSTTALFLVLCSCLWQGCKPTKVTTEEATAYRTELENMEKRSIRYRLLLRDSFGYTSPKAQAVIKEMTLLDSTYLLRFLELEKKYGFPTHSLVGERAANAAFGVLQHGDMKILAGYLKKLTKLAEKNEASWYNVALMTDRVLCSQNKKQLYGTQRDFKVVEGKKKQVVKPIADFKNIDQRRKKVGLDSFHIYLKENNYLYLDK
jgi:hypothetical protein